MTIEQGLYEHLIADSGVNAIVGTKVRPEHRRLSDGLPTIVYSRISSVREVDMSGPAPMVQARLQVDCWHSSYSGVKSLADAVRAALNGVGLASPRLLGTEPVQLVYLDGDQDLGEVEGDEREFRVSQDWIVIHLEA